MIVQALFQGLPETASLLLIALLLMDCRVPASKFGILTLIMAFMIIILRYLPLTFGLHVVAGILFLGLLLSFSTKKSLTISLMAAGGNLHAAGIFRIRLTFFDGPFY